MDIANELQIMGNRLLVLAREVAAPTTPKPAWVDLRAELPHNATPNNPGGVSGTDWAKHPEKTSITLHHVGAEGTTPQSVAAWTTRPYPQGKGLPRLQYHFWIARNATIYYCVDLSYGQWHDHDGYPNSNISVVMDGNLRTRAPSDKQINATAALLSWLLREYELSSEDVHGHSHYANTSCPGWAAWKDKLFAALREHTPILSFDAQGVMSTPIPDRLEV